MTKGNNGLTTEQVNQLVDAIVNDTSPVGPVNAYFALRDGPRFSTDHQKKLVDAVAKSSSQASQALRDLPWLTDEQKGKLTIVAGTAA